MTKYEEEVELAPGIFLTKYVKNELIVADQSKEVERKQMEFLEQHPKEHYEWVRAQIHRIENSLEKLEYSNKEMLAVDDKDPDFIEAVKENVIIMERQRKAVADYQKQAQQLAQQLGLCFQDFVGADQRTTTSTRAEELADLEGGVYL